jgi:flagellar basal body-associated protein FliL
MVNLKAGEAHQFARQEGRQEASMNHSIYSADRSTHLKIVVVALIAGIAVAGFGISARMTSNDSYAQNSRIIKAGQPVAITSSSTSMVR